MADSDRVAVRFLVEATFGNVEPSSPIFQELRVTSESLRIDTTTVNSAEIRADRQNVDVVRTNAQAAGSLNWELSFLAMDELFQYALLNAGFSTGAALTVGTDVTFVVGTNQYNIAAQAGVPFFGKLGEWLTITNADEANNNGLVKIIAVNNAGADADVAGNGNGVNDAADTNAVVTTMDEITNGTTLNSISLEKNFGDLSGDHQFELFTGMVIDQMSLNVAADSLVTGSFEFLGQDGVSAGGTASSGGTPVATPTNEVMSAVDSVVTILEGSGADAQYVAVPGTAMSFQLQNNLRGRLNIGDLGPSSVGTGVVNVTGTLQQYYLDKAIPDKHLLFTESALAIIVQDSAGNKYIFDFPRIQYTSGQRVAGGQNQDVIADMGWSAFRHATEDVTLRIVRTG